MVLIRGWKERGGTIGWEWEAGMEMRDEQVVASMLMGMGSVGNGYGKGDGFGEALRWHGRTVRCKEKWI